MNFPEVCIDTSIPVWIVMSGIYGAALLQMLVHLRFFLHLDTSPAGRGNLLSLVFTALILFLFIGGSLWIMFNLDYRMM